MKSEQPITNEEIIRQGGNMDGVELGLDERGNAELRRDINAVQEEMRQMNANGFVEMEHGGADPPVRIVGDAPYGRDIPTNMPQLLREQDRQQNGMMIPHGRDIPEFMGPSRPGPMYPRARVPVNATTGVSRQLRRALVRDLVRRRANGEEIIDQRRNMGNTMRVGRNLQPSGDSTNETKDLSTYMEEANTSGIVACL